jgi:hypothetical protein
VVEQFMSEKTSNMKRPGQDRAFKDIFPDPLPPARPYLLQFHQLLMVHSNFESINGLNNF